jgi:hypothetical protein
MVERNAVRASKTAVVRSPHVPFLAANRCFAALQVPRFASRKLTASYALRNPVLLELAALVDWGGMAWHRHWSGLAKADRRAKCEKSGAEQGSFHGDISLRGVGMRILSADPRSHSWRHELVESVATRLSI